MSYLGFFSEPIITSRGIIVGRNYDGEPHYVQQFPIYRPTYVGSVSISSNNNNSQYQSNYSSYSSNRGYSKPYQTISEAEADAEASWERLRQRNANK